MTFTSLYRGDNYAWGDLPHPKHNYRRTVEPANDPVTLTEAKDFLRIDDTADNAQVNSLIKAATSIAEEYLDRSIITQTWTMYLDYYPFKHYIRLPRGFVQSIVSFKAYADDDSSTTWDPQFYFLDTTYDRVMIRESGSWPTFERDTNGLEIVFIAGYGDNASDVPAPIKQAILNIALSLYEDREGSTGMPKVAEVLLHPFKRYWL